MITIAMMRAAGISEAHILRVVEIEERERTLQRREQNRKYQQNHRLRQQLRADSADSADSHIDTSSPRTENKKGRKISICTDWKPTDADRDYARKKGWSDERIDREAERFRIHYLANGKPWANWHLVWCKWVISSYQQNGNGGQHGTNRQGRDKRHSISAAFDDIFAKLEGSDGASVVPFQANPRLLPNRRRE